MKRLTHRLNPSDAKVVALPVYHSSSDTARELNISKNRKHALVHFTKRKASRNLSAALPDCTIEQHHCVICSGVLYKQIIGGQSQWYCSHCHEAFAESLIDAFSKAHQQVRTRYFRNHSRFVKVIQFRDPQTGHKEYVVFPGETVSFSLQDNTVVQIKSGEHITSLEADRVLGKNLPEVLFDDTRPVA